MDLNLNGQILTSIGFEYGIRLLFENRNSIYIESPALLSHGAEAVRVQSQEVIEGAVDVLKLLHLTVASATASDHGVLTLEMESGYTLTVSPEDDGFDSWSAFLAGGLRIFTASAGRMEIYDGE